MNAKRVGWLLALALCTAPARADYLITTPTLQLPGTQLQPVKAGAVNGSILNIFSPVDSTGAALGVPLNPFSVIAAPYQWQPAGGMQSQLAVQTAGSPTVLTVPTGAVRAEICVRDGGSSVNYSIDGTTQPTNGITGLGFQISPGKCVAVQGLVEIQNFKAIAAFEATAIDVGYDK